MKKNKQAQVRNKIIGLTGGIGSGKSEVAKIFQEKGIPVIDADKLSREITQPGSATLKKIVKTFGKTALHPDSTLNRPWLRQKIINEKGARKKLEAITHPEIRKLAKKKAAAFFKQGHTIVIYEAPLMMESGFYKNLDGIIGVFSEDARRIQRIIHRDKVSRAEAEKIIRSQMPQEEKMRLCTYQIANNGSLGDLQKSVIKILSLLNSNE